MAFSGMEWIIVGLVVIILFFGGAKKIPEFAANLGRARGEYERGKMEVEKQIAQERAAAAAAPAPAYPAPPVRVLCAWCGTEASAGSAFCAKCGKPLATPA